MTERLYANEAATAAINKMKCLDVRLGLYQVMVDFHEAMTASTVRSGPNVLLRELRRLMRVVCWRCNSERSESRLASVERDVVD